VQAVPGGGDASDADAGEIARLAALMPADETQLLYSMCLHGRGELGLAPDEYAALTMVLLRLLAFKPRNAADIPPPLEKKTLIDAGRPAAVTASVAAPALAPAPRAAALAPPPPPRAAVSVGAMPATRVSTAAVPTAAVPVAAAPPGRVLPVLDPPRRPPQQPSGGSANGQVVGVPVRVQAESPREAASARPSAPLVPTEEGDFWHALVQQLVDQQAITALVRELALQSQLVARDTGHWMLRVERESLNQAASRERLRNALAGAGHEVNLSVEVGAVSDSPARRNAAAAAEKQRAAEEIILNDPFIQSTRRDFPTGWKIISIQPRTINPTHQE
jgi:DNA polymerase-3 subunit gamma/tau